MYVFEVSPGGAAEATGQIRYGDQLVGVAKAGVWGKPFEDCIGEIKGAGGGEGEVELVLFRGGAEDLYGKAGASQEWLRETVEGGAKE